VGRFKKEKGLIRLVKKNLNKGLALHEKIAVLFYRDDIERSSDDI